jgi:lipopolysaccharide export system ATP-binding protein
VRNAAARGLAAAFQWIFSRLSGLFQTPAKATAVSTSYGNSNDGPQGAEMHAHESLPADWQPEDLPQPAASIQQGEDDRKERSNANIEGLLSVRHLRKIYKGRRVVEDVGLEVRRGEAIGLLGPNGAGKTTVFYMISGLVRPDVGAIEIDGQDVTVLPMYRRARLGIGYLPQEASVFRGLSVEQNILAVLEITQPNRRERYAELEGLLEEFDLARLRKSPAIALSGGERRRCEIARSLAGHPSFILLDEPFAGVDPIAVGDIQNLVQHLKQRGIGVLITDHNVRETLGLIDRAYIIHSGRVLTEGTPAQIVADPEVRRLYLGEDFRM